MSNKPQDQQRRIENKYQSSVPILKHISYDMQRKFKRLLLYLSLLAVLIFVLFPLFWMFSSALRPEAAMYERPMGYLPSPITLDHFASLIGDSQFVGFYINSLIYATGVVVLTVVASTLGGYGLTRVDIRFKKTFARAVLFGYMFPAILLAIPMFVLWSQIGLLDTYSGLILAETAISLPFSLWLMWKFFQTVPYSLEESARMAGATQFQSFYQIALPLAKPGMVAVAVYSYSVSWNQFTIPRVIMSDTELWPLTVGVFTLQQQDRVLWGELMAASALVLVPSFMFVFLLQKYLVQGFDVESA